MATRDFTAYDLKKIFTPENNSKGGDNGEITIIGGSDLFHGAPILSLKGASRIVDMVYFSSPEFELEKLALALKTKLNAFIWFPWVKNEIDSYIRKSDAVLIGPGLKRFNSQAKKPKEISTIDDSGKITKEITLTWLNKFPNKKWVVDAGSLQVIEPKSLPAGTVITPNEIEFEHLFRVSNLLNKSLEEQIEIVEQKAEQYRLIISFKGPISIISDGNKTFLINKGNPGLTKGGTGDVLAGVTVGMLAKNDALLAAAAAAFVLKSAADELFATRGTMYNADDLAEQIPTIWKELREFN